ncbi:MAG: ABC transporter substrate-binding protein [Burkholderiales bacterium]|nr:ABC transporter substrate-binding protein [Burkholderiales bacterium]
MRLLLSSAPRCVLAAFALAAFAASAAAGPLDDLAAAAEKKGQVTWYESSPPDQADKVIAAFNKRFPNVKVKQVRLVGGNELAVRTVQEMQARGYSADALTGGADHIWQLQGRGYLEPVDWAGLGVAKGMSPAPFTLATAASVYVILWNDKKVQESETPKTWAEVSDPKWTGRMGSWVRASAYAQLASKFGPEKAQAMLEQYVKLKPMLFKSTFPLAQAVGAGEVDIGVGFYHTTLPPIAAGAPIKYKVLDVVPMHTIYSSVTKNARNPEGAKLFLAWLATDEGALAYEAATSRGNPFVASTKTAQLIKGRDIAEYPPAQSDTLSKVNEGYNKILEAVGAAR